MAAFAPEDQVRDDKWPHLLPKSKCVKTMAAFASEGQVRDDSHGRFDTEKVNRHGLQGCATHNLDSVWEQPATPRTYATSRYSDYYQ